MGLRNRQRARTIEDVEKRRQALRLFTSVAHPTTWTDPAFARHRAEQRTKREAKDAEWEMRRGWSVPIGRER